MTNKSKKSMDIAAIGMDKQTQRILEMVFHGPGKDNYVLVKQLEKAQACIFDLDSLEGMKLWKDYRNRYPQLPTIILSINHKEIAGTILVKKPIEIDKLLKSLEKARKLFAEPLVSKLAARDHNPESDSQQPQALSDAKLAIEILEDKNINQFCGNAEDINPSNKEEVKKFFYEHRKYLQGFLENAFDFAQQLEDGGLLIEGLYTSMILLPKRNRILLGKEFNENKLRTMTLLPLSNITVLQDVNQSKPSKVHLDDNRILHLTSLNETELVQYQENHQLTGQALDGFLWQIALWTARGRLPKGTDLYEPVVLLHWPNFTRLIETPYALKISAIWMAHSYSLLETAQILKIPQRYVFAFYSATHAIKLAFTDKPVTKKGSNSTLFTPHNKRSLFQRILARLYPKDSGE